MMMIIVGGGAAGSVRQHSKLVKVHAVPAADIARVGAKHNHERRLIGGDQRLPDREPVAVRHATQPVLYSQPQGRYSRPQLRPPGPKPGRGRLERHVNHRALARGRTRVGTGRSVRVSQLFLLYKCARLENSGDFSNTTSWTTSLSTTE